MKSDIAYDIADIYFLIIVFVPTMAFQVNTYVIVCVQDQFWNFVNTNCI